MPYSYTLFGMSVSRPHRPCSLTDLAAPPTRRSAAVSKERRLDWQHAQRPEQRRVPELSPRPSANELRRRAGAVVPNFWVTDCHHHNATAAGLSSSARLVSWIERTRIRSLMSGRCSTSSWTTTVQRC